MNIHYGYKVVRKGNRGFVSTIRTPSKVTYRINQWTEPNKGKGALAVFSRYKDAEEFIAACCQRGKLYACQYVQHKGKAPYQSNIIGKVFASKVKLTRWYGE